VDLAVETHDALCTTGSCLRLQDALGEPTALLWDAHHIWFKAAERPLETWSALRPFVRHVHVKDSVREPILPYPYTYRLPGEGDLPPDALLHRLAADGYEGCVSLEWERAWHPYLPGLGVAPPRM
jgi:sugar phosphate isomerase/epimerase